MAASFIQIVDDLQVDYYTNCYTDRFSNALELLVAR